MSKITTDNYEAFLLDYAEGNLDKYTIELLKAFAHQHPELGIEIDETDLPSLVAEDIEAGFKKSLNKAEEFLPDEILINYLENKLSDKEHAQFELRLLADKALNYQLALYRATVLQPENEITYENKTGLHKFEDDLVLSNKALAYLEGSLSAEDVVAFNSELNENALLAAEYQQLKKTILQADVALVYPDKAGLKKSGKVVVLFSYRRIAALAASLLLLLGIYSLFFTDGGMQPSTKMNVNELSHKTGMTNHNSATQASLPGSNSQKKRLAQTSTKPTTKTVKLTKAIKQPGDSLRGKSYSGTQLVEQSVTQDTSSMNGTLIANAAETSSANTTSRLANEISLTRSDDSNASLVIGKELMKPITELATINDDDENECAPESSRKKNFWQRAVTVAKKANGLGFKALDGEQNTPDSYLLSFNSLSIEKK